MTLSERLPNLHHPPASPENERPKATQKLAEILVANKGTDRPLSLTDLGEALYREGKPLLEWDDEGDAKRAKRLISLSISGTQPAVADALTASDSLLHMGQREYVDPNNPRRRLVETVFKTTGPEGLPLTSDGNLEDAYRDYSWEPVVFHRKPPKATSDRANKNHNQRINPRAEQLLAALTQSADKLMYLEDIAETIYGERTRKALTRAASLLNSFTSNPDSLARREWEKSGHALYQATRVITDNETKKSQRGRRAYRAVLQNTPLDTTLLPPTVKDSATTTHLSWRDAMTNAVPTIEHAESSADAPTEPIKQELTKPSGNLAHDYLNLLMDTPGTPFTEYEISEHIRQLYDGAKRGSFGGSLKANMNARASTLAERMLRDGIVIFKAAVKPSYPTGRSRIAALRTRNVYIAATSDMLNQEGFTLPRRGTLRGGSQQVEATYTGWQQTKLRRGSGNSTSIWGEWVAPDEALL